MNLNIFVTNEAEGIIKRYKMPVENVKSKILEDLKGNSSLLTVIENSENLRDVQRTRNYKDFSKKIRKDIYYELRQYRQSGGSSAEDHVSTKERSPYVQEFNDRLYAHLSEAEYIIDIGGGVFPLTFPFDRYTNLKKYVWIDKDVKAFDTLRELKIPKLVLFNGAIGEKPWEHYLPPEVVQFDAALMIKLVSVINRQERALIPTLVSVPAKVLVVTAPKESMTKKENIEKREKEVLKRFIDQSGKEIFGELDVPNEFGYFLR
jgi:hypothetical protein